MAAERTAQRFRMGDVPPLAEGFTDRPDTARGIAEALVPGASLALVPGSAFAEGPSNWLGACGKTQIAVIIAESLWRARTVDALIWISATNRASVLSGYVQASVAAFGVEPTGSAESVAARFVSWLSATKQSWLVVLDDLPEDADMDGLWPEGPAGRVLITCNQSSIAQARRGTQAVPIGFYSVREALNCLTERLSVNPAQRQGAIDLIEALGREPLALAQASAVVANSTLACRDYRDYFARRRVYRDPLESGNLYGCGGRTGIRSVSQRQCHCGSRQVFRGFVHHGSRRGEPNGNGLRTDRFSEYGGPRNRHHARTGAGGRGPH